MAITVTPTVPLSGGSKTTAASGSASSGGPTSEPAAGDFAALLAGQLIDLSQPVPGISGEQPLPLPGTGVQDAQEELPGAARSEETDITPLSAIALFDTLAARPTGKSEQSDASNKRSFDASIGAQVGATDKQTQNPGASVAALLSTRAQAAEALLGSGEAAKVAGENQPATPTNFANALAAQERTNNTMRSDNQQSIATPLHDPRWAQQLGERVVWLARGEVQNAQINISPAQLGPIQINITLNGDQMSAHFVTAHQEVRQALEDAMPRLREMLSGAGINLGQANVGSQAQQQQQQQAASSQFGDTPRSSGEDAILSPDKHTDSGIAGLPVQRGRGLVDLFA